MPLSDIRFVSFDAAGTLIQNRYRPGRFAVACAESVDLGLRAEAAHSYEVLFKQRLGLFWQVNQARDPSKLAGFWLDLTTAWLHGEGEPAAAPLVVAEAKRQLLETDNWFSLFDDTLAALDQLDKLGIPAVVLSNWDTSLHDILKSKGIYDRFQFVIASLEEGVEKPDPLLFTRLLERLDATPNEVLHVGDDWHDDVHGAQQSGLHWGFLDRLNPEKLTEWLDSGSGERLCLKGNKLTDFTEVLASA